VPLRIGEGGTTVTLSAPDGRQVDLPVGKASYSDTFVPGVYTVHSSSAATDIRFAVNLDPTESRTRPVAADEFERLGVPVAHPVGTLTPETKRQVRLQNAELENRQKLWRWLILGTLAVLLMETYLAGRAARKVLVQEEPASAT